MAKITNKSNHPLRHIIGSEVIDIQPGETRTVADSKELAESAFVKAKWLEYVGGDNGDFEGTSSKSLTVGEIKAALEEMGVAIPEGVTKKNDLLALLNDQETGTEE
ncbi:MAG: hypothetical protein ACTJHW_03835 [Paenalcaligenes sp.]